MDDKGVIINGAVGEKEFQRVVESVDNRLDHIEDNLNKISDKIGGLPCTEHVKDIELNTKFREKFTLAKVLGIMVAVIATIKGLDYIFGLIKG